MNKRPVLVILRCDLKEPQDYKNFKIAQGTKEFEGGDSHHCATIFAKYPTTIVKYVTIKNFKDAIRAVCPDPSSDDFIFLNLCDGVEVDGFVCPSLIRFLEEEKYLRYPCSFAFSAICNYKIDQKKKFDELGVSTSPWVLVGETWDEEKRQAVMKLKFPLIVKASDYYCCVGLTVNSRCDTIEQVESHVKSMIPAYGRVIVEEFIIGREFIVIVMDEKDGSVYAYPPSEVLFPKKLPLEEKFWNYYAVTKDGRPIKIKTGPCAPEFVEPLKALGIAAYKAVYGKGYGKIDIRQNIETGTFYVLEINDFSSIGPGMGLEKTLNVSGLTLRDFGKRFLELTPYH